MHGPDSDRGEADERRDRRGVSRPHRLGPQPGSSVREAGFYTSWIADTPCRRLAARRSQPLLSAHLVTMSEPRISPKRWNLGPGPSVAARVTQRATSRPKPFAETVEGPRQYRQGLRGERAQSRSILNLATDGRSLSGATESRHG